MVLLILLLACVALVSLLLPWIQRSQLSDFEQRIDRIEWKLAQLVGAATKTENPFVRNGNLTPQPFADDEPKAESLASPPPTQPDFTVSPRPSPTPSLPTARYEEPSENDAIQETSSGFFELFAATKLPVWIGAVAIVFAVVYLVRYSIEMGLLSPIVRLSLGFGFGLALVQVRLDFLEVRFPLLRRHLIHAFE